METNHPRLRDNLRLLYLGYLAQAISVVIVFFPLINSATALAAWIGIILISLALFKCN